MTSWNSKIQYSNFLCVHPAEYYSDLFYFIKAYQDNDIWHLWSVYVMIISFVTNSIFKNELAPFFWQYLLMLYRYFIVQLNILY
jgi:hypothetical protein